MTKAVLLSIRPKYCELIASGKKTIEVRKTRPAIAAPFKCYIYETKTGYRSKSYENDILVPYQYAGKVIGEFVCDKIDKIRRIGCTQNDMRLCVVDESLYCHELDYEYVNNKCCISIRYMEGYANGGTLYGWHISDLVIYDEPKELSKFWKPCPHGEVSCFLCGKSGYNEDMHIDCFNNLIRAPQSWCYVEELR